MDLGKVAKKHLVKSDVVYIASDGTPFFEYHFAKNYADKKGLTVQKFEKNGTK